MKLKDISPVVVSVKRKKRVFPTTPLLRKFPSYEIVFLQEMEREEDYGSTEKKIDKVFAALSQAVNN